MRVRFQQSGGFLGLTQGCEIATEELPGPLAALAADLVHLPVVSAPANPKMRDGLHYRIALDEGGRHLQLDLSPTDLPERFTPLLNHLVSSSRPQPLG